MVVGGSRIELIDVYDSIGFCAPRADCRSEETTSAPQVTGCAVLSCCEKAFVQVSTAFKSVTGPRFVAT